MARKKAQVGLGTTIADFFAYLAMAIVIVIVILTFTLQARSQHTEIREAAFENENQQFLISLLKSDVNNTYKEEQTNITLLTLVSLWFYDESTYKDILKSSIEKALNDYYGGKVIFALEAKHSTNTQEVKNSYEGIKEGELLFETNVQVPLFWKGDPLIKTGKPLPEPYINLTFKVYIGMVKKESRCWFMIPKLYERNSCAIDGTYAGKQWLCSCKLVGLNGLFWTDCKECANGCNSELNQCN